MVVDKSIQKNGMDKMVYGQNGIGQNGIGQNSADKMVLTKMVRLKWYRIKPAIKESITFPLTTGFLINPASTFKATKSENYSDDLNILYGRKIGLFSII